MENLVIFYGRLAYFTAIGNTLWPFDIFCGNMVYFSPFWYFGPRKIWQPWFIPIHKCTSVIKSNLILVVDVKVRV
jgi:hypothetical protein